jgi:transcriptional regulator GlxA family with amidase domain
MSSVPVNALPTRFGFVLVPDFTLISMSSAVETLRMANRICKKEVYQWRTISADGEAVCASDGLSVNVDDNVENEDLLRMVDAVIVCGGRRIEDHSTESLFRFLRKAAQSGLGLGATCTGSYLLASAGLLDGLRCSVHWENIATMTDAFPDVRVTRRIYTIDRNRYTSSGGTAPIDMMLYFVRNQCGAEISAGVADQFIYERVRNTDDLQRVPLRHFVGKQSTKLITAVELMEANIREPISQGDLAAYVDLSRRQLQRLFQNYLLCTPSRYYRQLRLQRARDLLHRSDLNLAEVAAQTGFVSTSHFSKSYKEHYGYSPSAERRQNVPGLLS